MEISNGVKIIFVGTPEYGAIVLQGLVRNGYKPVLVVTAPDKPVGRKQIITPPPVKVIAQKYKIPVEQDEKEDKVLFDYLKFKIKNLKPDLGIVAAYGHIIPQEILTIPKYGFVNVHPSLLPRWRGSSPVQYTILEGDEKTGVTIIEMTDKVDAGPVIAQEEIKIEGNETYEILHNKLAGLGADLLLETIPKWLSSEIKPNPQNEVKATYAKILKKENGKINWEKPAEALEREIRAFYPWPGSYAIWENHGLLTKIKILKSRVYKPLNLLKTKYRAPRQQGEGEEEGEVLFDYPIGKVLVVPQNEIGVQCEKDFLVIEKLQMEGKKEMTAEDFLRGHFDFIGTILK